MEQNQYACPHCKTLNYKEDTICVKCNESTLTGFLLSMGTGTCPKNFKWPLLPTNLNVGSNTSNDIIIPSNRAAKLHCQISYKDKLFFLKTLGADKPVFLGKKLLEEQKEHKLPPNSIIRIGIDQIKINYLQEPVRNPDQTEGEFREKLTNNRVAKEQASNPLSAKMMLTIGYLKELKSAKNFTDLFNSGLDTLLKVSNLDRAYAFIVNHKDGKPNIQEITSRKKGGVNFTEDHYTISKSSLKEVMETKKMVIIDDTYNDENVTSKSIYKFEIKTIICLPVLRVNKKTQEIELKAILYADKVLASRSLPDNINSTLNLITQMISTNMEHCAYIQKIATYEKSFHQRIESIHSQLVSLYSNLEIIDNNLSQVENIEELSTIKDFFTTEKNNLIKLCNDLIS